jgi:hypothetical protein
MNSIQRIFLRSKHWEIFLLCIAMGFFFRLVINVLLGNPPFSSTTNAPDNFLIRVLQSGTGIGLYAWAYFAGSFLNSISPARLRLRHFVFFVALGVSVLLDLFPTHWWDKGIPLLFGLLPIDLICYAYIVRFPSKSLVIAEEQNPAPFSQYKNEFILAFFYPIGIWFLQPRINELYAAHQNSVTAIDPADSTTQLPA